MKNSLRIVATLIVAILFVGPHLHMVFAEDLPEQPVGNTVSTRCQKILADGKARQDVEKAAKAGKEAVEAVNRAFDTITGGTTATSDPGTSPNEVVVFLTESISSSGLDYSCGEAVQCLRDKWRGKKDAERLVTNDVKEGFKFCIVSGKDGLELLSNYAAQVYQWIAGVVGAICILVIIISGIQISIGGLSQEEVSTAKDRVIRALVGMVVLFLSAFILYAINPIFFT